MHYIDMKNCLDSKLQIYSICSIGIRSRNRDNFENINPFQTSSSPVWTLSSPRSTRSSLFWPKRQKHFRKQISVRPLSPSIIHSILCWLLIRRRHNHSAWLNWAKCWKSDSKFKRKFTSTRRQPDKSVIYSRPRLIRAHVKTHRYTF